MLTTPSNQECKSVDELAEEYAAKLTGKPISKIDAGSVAAGKYLIRKKAFIAGYEAGQAAKEWAVSCAIKIGRQQVEAAASKEKDAEIKRLVNIEKLYERKRAQVIRFSHKISKLQSQLTAAVEREKVLLDALEHANLIVKELRAAFEGKGIQVENVITVWDEIIAKHREMKGADK